MGRKRRVPPLLPLFDEPLLCEELTKAGIKADHVKKIYPWVLQHLDEPLSSLDFAGLNIPRRAAAVLEKFTVVTSSVAKVEESQIDHTVKLLVRLHDGKEVEAVIINHLGDPFAAEGGVNRGQRATLCLSSQVGCAMGCQFCATGTLGLDGNLLAGEILEQMVHARRVRPDITNIVFMGMGEPLDNYDAVVAAVRGLTAPYCFALPHRGITVSTVGVVSRIEQLARDCPSVKLAFSLHAPNQALREEIVPSAKAYPLAKIMEGVALYAKRKHSEGREGKKQGMVMIEYVMLAGVNDQRAHAEELIALLQGLNVVVNLIPYNPFPGAPRPFETPSPAVINAFIDVLTAQDVKVFERRHHGRDIQAACGQLAKQSREGEGDVRADVAIDVEELPWETPAPQAPPKKRILLGRDKREERGSAARLAVAAGLLAATALAVTVLRRR